MQQRLLDYVGARRVAHEKYSRGISEKIAKIVHNEDHVIALRRMPKPA
jgi:hypothetical protein